MPALPYTQHPCEQCGSAGGQQNTVCSSLKRKGGATHPRTDLKAVTSKVIFCSSHNSHQSYPPEQLVLFSKGPGDQADRCHRNYLKWKSQQYQEWVRPLLVLLPWVRPAVLANLAVFSSNQATDIRLVCVCPLH